MLIMGERMQQEEPESQSSYLGNNGDAIFGLFCGEVDADDGVVGTDVLVVRLVLVLVLHRVVFVHTVEARASRVQTAICIAQCTRSLHADRAHQNALKAARKGTLALKSVIGPGASCGSTLGSLDSAGLERGSCQYRR